MGSDGHLHCNWLKCRKSLLLDGKAVVTTCSHIFCVPCAEQLFTSDKTCPACKTVLDQPDDVVLSSLTPSADYRTSVLAGLSPDVVVDIAARSLAFWQYQQSQETAFQAMVLKASQERNSMLEKRLQTMIVEANCEITLLQEKIQTLESGLAAEKRKNRDLQDNIRSVTKECERLRARPAQDDARNLTSSSSVPAGNFGNSLSTQRSGPALFWQTHARGQQEGARPPSQSKFEQPATASSARGKRSEAGQAVLNTAYEPSLQHNRFTPATRRTDSGPRAAQNSANRADSRHLQSSGRTTSVFGQQAAPLTGVSDLAIGHRNKVQSGSLLKTAARQTLPSKISESERPVGGQPMATSTLRQHQSRSPDNGPFRFSG